MTDTAHKQLAGPLMQKRKGKKIVAGVALLAAVGLGWMAYGKYKELEQAINIISQSQLALKKQAQLDHHSRLTPSDVEAQVAPVAERVMRISETTLQQMTLVQSEALVQMASLEVQNLRAVPIAIRQLKMAEGQVAGLANPTLAPLQKALGTLIGDLHLIAETPWEHRWRDLGKISLKLDSLPWILGPTRTVEAPVVDNSDRTWREMLEDLWQELRGLIHIRSISKEARSLVTVEERSILTHALKLSLEEARWALVYQNDTVYQESIHSVYRQVETYFQNEDPAVQEVLKDLAYLKTTSAEVQLPDFSPVLTLYTQALSQQGVMTP